MYLIEMLGDSLYAHLAVKEKDPDLKRIYEQLAANERDTGKDIKKAIDPAATPNVKTDNRVIMSLASLIFRIMPNRFLLNVLKAILNKKKYSRWAKMYNEHDPGLWQSLVAHEELQHKLLSPYLE